MEVKLLEGLGFSRNEARVYIALLRVGSASVGTITEESGVHRRNVYDALERLARKGLVGHTVKNRTRYFEVSSPHLLLDMVAEKRRLLEKRERDIKSMVSRMVSREGERQDVKIYSGPESRRVVFEDILNTTKQNLVLGAHTPSRLSRRYLRKWHKRRVERGIKDKLIYNYPDPYAKEMSKLPFTEVRFAPKRIDSKTAINIYGNKVAILLWSGEKPVTILIDNKRVARDFREYFNFLWGVAREGV